jgi:hypothetical protein
MLTQDQIIPFLLERCPEFAPTWEDHHNGVTADVGPYIDVAEFVHFVLDFYERGNRELMPRAFQAVEDLLIEGDSTVQEIVALGILETLQCAASWKPYGNEAFIQWLGPKSRIEWDELVEVWRGKNSLADVVRAEQSKNAIDAPFL